MSNDYYNTSGWPAQSQFGSSSPARSELASIAAGFGLFASFSSANAGAAMIVNPGKTGWTTTTGALALAGALTTTGAFSTTLVQGANVSLTLPIVSGTLATLAGTETLSNKTISGASNTLSGIGNAALTNSSVTIGSTSVSLGATAATVAGLSLTGSPSLALRDTSAAFDVTIGATSSVNLTTGRTLTIDVANAARTLKLTGNATLNQDVSTTGAPTFAGIVTGAGEQAAAVQNTWYTIISAASLSSKGPGRYVVTIGSNFNISGGCCEILHNSSTSSVVNVGGTNFGAQIDGSGNFQVRCTTQDGLKIDVNWIFVVGSSG